MGTSYSKGKLAIVFADICRSTQLFERFGDARAMQIVGHTLELLVNQTERHGGEVVKTIGDEVMATFADGAAAAAAAAAMQRATNADPALAEVGLHVRIGLHFGDVLVEDGDVYGDAVNVAARMAALAKAEQVITTQATVERFPPEARLETRSLGYAAVRGKEHPLEIYEVLWRQDASMLTAVAARPWQALTNRARSLLVLEYRAQRIVLEPNAVPFRMGRSAENELVVPSHNVSRTHATIEFSKGRFILIDRSTNGTFLRMDTEEVFLHRDQVRLLQEGVLSLGLSLSDETAEQIRYRCEY